MAIEISEEQAAVNEVGRKLSELLTREQVPQNTACNAMLAMIVGALRADGKKWADFAPVAQALFEADMKVLVAQTGDKAS